MSDKFFIKHDNIALLVNTMAVRLSEWSGSLSEIMASFDSFSASEGFTGGSANIAKEYCATYYGSSGISSLPILLSESSVAISEALLLYEKTFLDYDTVDKFSISEDKIDYIIQDAGVEAIGDFETIHENAINIINSISDIVELPKPDDTYYIQDSEDIVSQLEEVKEDIYELEAAELVIIEELNEQIDSLLALVESYSNKTKRATSFVSSDEIITSELETAIEEYAKSCRRRQLNAANLEAAKAQHAATMERIQKEFEERRKKQGEQKIKQGIFAATVGTLCIVCTAGAASPVVIGAGLTFGTGSLLYGDSYIQEGEEDIYYASIGDVSTPASNYIRDTVFQGNQELYDLWGSINVSGAMSMIPVGLKGSGVLRSSVNMTSSSLATETRFVVYDTIASESASFGVGEYCDYKGIEGTDKLMLQSATSFVTSLGIVKASEIGQGAEQITKFSYDDLPGEEAVFRLDDVNLEKLDAIDSRPIGYYEKPSIKNGESFDDLLETNYRKPSGSSVYEGGNLSANMYCISGEEHFAAYKEMFGAENVEWTSKDTLSVADRVRVQNWGDNLPSDEMYLKYKDVYQNDLYYNQATGDINWPINDGFSEYPSDFTLEVGSKIDRYGSDYGTFTSPLGIAYEQRALAPGTELKPYSVFEVLKPIDVKAGGIAPWFNQPGGGIQYIMPDIIDELIDTGYLRRIN